MGGSVYAKMQGRALVDALLTSGTAVEVQMENVQVPCTVWVEPTGGDTVTVTYKNSPTAPAQNWPVGAVVAYSEDVLDAPVYSITFQRTAGSGTTSKYGIAQ
jgi:hypothetical protein